VDIVGALVSEELERPRVLTPDESVGKYVVLVDPVDGSSNLDVDCMVGSIFSIRELKDGVGDSILDSGTKQIAAGYLMYGPSTILVYTAGDGLHSFVLDEQIGEFVLDHEAIRMPDKGKIVSANFGNYGKWSRPAKAFADSVMSGELGSYSLRYSGALVADLHQILHNGGLYFYPDEEKRPEGKLRLMYECAPLAMVAEQAGGTATTGTERVMSLCPEKVHQRIPFAIGSRREVEAYESHYRGSRA
jgi:fructose-1,6-bisphosphatase I